MSQIEKLVRGIENCPCGRVHACPVEAVEIGPAALARLPELCRPYRNILLVADENTWRVCGHQAAQALEQKATPLILPGQPVVPNEETIAKIVKNLMADTDLILGVGSGVINDLCKHVSFRHDLPYFIVATAPSMDGYVSVGAALILGGMKVTLNARPPKAVIADTAVLKNAPMDMLRAGWGDIVGKYSCLNDWKLSAFVNGEYFCQNVYDLVMDTTLQVEKLAPGVLNRDEEAVARLMEALVTVGAAMSFVGNSRPASGSEHQLSHFFEITGLVHGRPHLPHGTDVLYAAVVTARLRRLLLEAKPERQIFDRTVWEQTIRQIYGSTADGVIELQDRLGMHTHDDSARVIPGWERIRGILAEAPSEAEMTRMVQAIGLQMADYNAFYGPDRISDAIRCAMDLKERYCVLWLFGQWHRTIRWE